MNEAEYRIERQKLVRRQHAIANEINSVMPVAIPPGYPPSTKARLDSLYLESRENATTIQAIDKALLELAAQ